MKEDASSGSPPSPDQQLKGDEKRSHQCRDQRLTEQGLHTPAAQTKLKGKPLLNQICTSMPRPSTTAPAQASRPRLSCADRCCTTAEAPPPPPQQHQGGICVPGSRLRPSNTRPRQSPATRRTPAHPPGPRAATTATPRRGRHPRSSTRTETPARREPAMPTRRRSVVVQTVHRINPSSPAPSQWPPEPRSTGAAPSVPAPTVHPQTESPPPACSRGEGCWLGTCSPDRRAHRVLHEAQTGTIVALANQQGVAAGAWQPDSDLRPRRRQLHLDVAGVTLAIRPIKPPGPRTASPG